MIMYVSHDNNVIFYATNCGVLLTGQRFRVQHFPVRNAQNTLIPKIYLLFSQRPTTTTSKRLETYFHSKLFSIP